MAITQPHDSRVFTKQSLKRPGRAIVAPHAGYTLCGPFVLLMLTNQWIHLLLKELSFSGLLIMCPLLGRALSSVDIEKTPLCDLVPTKQWIENYGRQECPNTSLCRLMKVNTVLKCICFMQLTLGKSQRFCYYCYTMPGGDL